MNNLTLLKALEFLLPLFTFIAGYLLSNIDKYIDNKKRKNNVRAILFKEMSENYKLINKFISNKKNNRIPPNLIALVTIKLSFTIYEKYLDRLDILKTNELNSIYDSYYSMKIAYDASSEFLTKVDNENTNRSLYVAKATEVLVYVDAFYEKLELALMLFKNGEKFIKLNSSEKGSAFNIYEDWSNQLKEEK
jgi:hypothetical protein